MIEFKITNNITVTWCRMGLHKPTIDYRNGIQKCTACGKEKQIKFCTIDSTFVPAGIILLILGLIYLLLS